ncbi:hypothetical protein SY83_11780 [Paenibacillus swuensis]|uniref:Uncharacterized protein n=1 Tax=Paenibacillus swuensis TaxID=1178515 RepID=A0A172TIH1_9BACL|nr:hypothetical protein SY83_11780 [Paenibacillus swuensis]
MAQTSKKRQLVLRGFVSTVGMLEIIPAGEMVVITRQMMQLPTRKDSIAAITLQMPVRNPQIDCPAGHSSEIATNGAVRGSHSQNSSDNATNAGAQSENRLPRRS